MSRYRIAPERSQFWAEARSSLHPIRVHTTGFEGSLELEITHGTVERDAPITGQVELATERLKTGNPLFDYELERRLDARRHPRIIGRVDAVQPLDGNRWRVSGRLTFHGVTKKVEGEVAIRSLDDETLEIEGERVFDMREFGLEPPRLLMLRVQPGVRVRGRVVAERER